MKSRTGFSKMVPVAVLALVGLVLVPGLAMATKKEPPPPPWHLQGPALVGTLMAVWSDDPSGGKVSLTISVDSKGVSYNATGEATGIPYSDFAAFTAADLEETWLDYSITSQLGSSNYLTINTVTKFNNIGTVITANIVILSGVSQ